MKTIDSYRNHPDFEFIRKEVLKMGIDDPFFDNEGFVGGYWLQQNSYEFAAFILMMKEMFPEGMPVYAEIGTAAGGFLRAFYELVGFGNAISIDNGQWRSEIYPQNAKAINAPIYRFIGDSHSPECATWLSEQIANLGPIDFFFIDGDHSYEGVKQDIFLAQRILPAHSLVGFHDIECSRTPGVTKAYKEMKNSLELGHFVGSGENKMGIGVVELL